MRCTKLPYVGRYLYFQISRGRHLKQMTITCDFLCNLLYGHDCLVFLVAQPFTIQLRRRDCGSTKIARNRPLKDWGQFIGDVPAVVRPFRVIVPKSLLVITTSIELSSVRWKTAFFTDLVPNTVRLEYRKSLACPLRNIRSTKARDRPLSWRSQGELFLQPDLFPFRLNIAPRAKGHFL